MKTSNQTLRTQVETGERGNSNLELVHIEGQEERHAIHDNIGMPDKLVTEVYKGVDQEVDTGLTRRH